MIDVAQPDMAQRDAAFYSKLERSMREAFAKAQAAHELHFVMALSPEMRGMQSAGWSTAHDAAAAFDQYLELIEKMQPAPIRIRIALALYNHVAESSGLYEVLKKMLLTIEGKGNNMWPFQSLVESHKRTGAIIAPNANRIMQDMAGHAAALGLVDLSEVIRDAFDPDVRNAVAHADYIVWHSGLRLRKRNGGTIREIPWPDFDVLLARGLSLFNAVRLISSEFVEGYDFPKTIWSQLHNEPPGNWTIHYSDGRFGITSGNGNCK